MKYRFQEDGSRTHLRSSDSRKPSSVQLRQVGLDQWQEHLRLPVPFDFSKRFRSQLSSRPGKEAANIMLPLIFGLVLFTCQGWLALSSPAKYDQRQEGDINVQIDLKDVKIVALVKSDIFDDYTNYDYVYDYADFTLKPIVKPTTKPPATTSIKPSESSTVSSSDLENKTTESSSTTSATTINSNQILENSTTSESHIDKTTPIKLLEKITNATKEAPSSTAEALVEKPVQNQSQTKRCRKGVDKSGRCHRRRISLLPLAMKVAPELVRSMRKRISI